MAGPLHTLAGLMALAEDGIDYSPRHGALCPGCRHPAKIYKTMPWNGTTRVRYHTCTTPGCPLCILGCTIKSVQVDSAPNQN